jgi:AsmA protein
MKLRTRRYARNGLIAIGLFLLACWVVPSLINAERYRHRVEAGLERALNRPVTFGYVTYRLLPRPGFSIENAVVREDPAFGFEPFARVDRIDCDLRWRSLLHSRLDCARLFLERPSFNLVRNPNGAWNVESFLQKNRLAAPGPTRGGTAVALENLDLGVDDARIDFSMGPNKKPFALTEMDASLNFDRRAGLLAFRLEASGLRARISKVPWTPHFAPRERPFIIGFPC